MLLTRQNWKYHAPWASLALLMVVGAIAWYALAALAAGRWLGGGSVIGLVTGTVAGLIIFSEMLLWPRKWLRRLKLVPAKVWMAAHLWLGLAVLPLAIVHCGMHLGGLLPTLLMIALALTYVSGIYGLLVQQFVPRWMLGNLQAETIHSQIDYVATQGAEDMRRVLMVACGPAGAQREGVLETVGEGKPSGQRRAAAAGKGSGGEEFPEPVVIGTLRGSGGVGGRVLETRTVTAVPQDAETLWQAYDILLPYLRHGEKADPELAQRRHIQALLGRLRRLVSEDGQALVEMLDQLCEQRRQFDVQRRVQRWLQGWIPLHVAASVVVTVLLIAHIWTALRYW